MNVSTPNFKAIFDSKGKFYDNGTDEYSYELSAELPEASGNDLKTFSLPTSTIKIRRIAACNAIITKIQIELIFSSPGIP